MKKLFYTLFAFAFASMYAQSWNTTGNAGTNPSTNFIGTTDNVDLVIKTNNQEKLRITNSGRIVLHATNNTISWFPNVYIGGGNDNPSIPGSSNWGNVSLGLGSMTSVVSASANTAVGFNTLAYNTTGYSNTAIGINSIMNCSSCSLNTGISTNALSNLISGDGNTSVGVSAMAGRNGFTGTNNVALGLDAIRNIFRGSYNTIVGGRSFRNLHTGSNNIVLGYDNLSGYELTNVNNNIFIGNNITPLALQPSNELNIGNWIYGLNGKISIGGSVNFNCTGCADYQLFVKNGIRTEKVKVDIASTNGWADYVFQKDYKLMPLSDLDQFIKTKGHLPEVPTTEEAIANGIELKEMNILLLKKVEELTLYTIEQQKLLEKLKSDNADLQKVIKRVEAIEKVISNQ